MIIYLLYCSQSRKGYVGQTIHTLETRWSKHVRDARRGSPYAIHRAIRKYGEDSFEQIILDDANTLSELNKLEIYHINKQNTLSPNGYNLHTGGRAHKVSNETKRKQSLSHKGNKLGPYSLEHRSNIALALKGNKNGKGNKGRVFSPKTISKMRLAARNRSRSPKGRAEMSRRRKLRDVQSH